MTNQPEPTQRPGDRTDVEPAPAAQDPAKTPQAPDSPQDDEVRRSPGAGEATTAPGTGDPALDAADAPVAVEPQGTGADDHPATGAATDLADQTEGGEPTVPTAPTEQTAAGEDASTSRSASTDVQHGAGTGAAGPAAPSPSSVSPRPAPDAPSPAALAAHKPSPTAPGTPPAGPTAAASEAAMAFGRADADGTVYVRTPDGERKVGQYPGASERDAVAYFARKYDELAASAELLYQRVLQGNVSAKESSNDLAALRKHIGDADVVGDLPALHAKVEDISTAVDARRQVEATERAAAREQARAEREKIVVEAERIAAQDPSKTQWKASGARIRELLEEWKAHQRSAAKLDRESENALWQRFSGARNSFDKGRRAFFAELESTQGEAKATKTKLVTEAERLATSTDWSATAGAFKRLMDQWRKAGRAGRHDDDALWARFKSAQDQFFAAKDEQAAKEDEAYRGNLVVKEQLLKEAEALLPVKDLDSTKARLRTIQDKWDAAGKVPRADLGRVEGALRRVEQAVRDAEDARWKKSNPERQHRVSAFAEQLERGVEQARADLEKAKASGDDRKIKSAEEALATREQWLRTALAAGS